MVVNFLKEMDIMKRFILIMFVFSFLFMFTLPFIGILLGYFFSFGIIEFIFGRYFIGELFIILSPILSFIVYLVYFDYPEDVIPITKFKNHIPKIHFIDNDILDLEVNNER